MKRIYTVMEYVPLLAGMLMLLSSCEHKDLCFDHDVHAPKSEVRIEAEYEKEWQYTYENGTDWKNYPTWQESFGMEYDALRPGIPDGLRVQVYNADGSDEIINIAPEGDVVYMRPGEHSLLFYNNDTEYIVFDKMQSFASAKATTRTRTRSSYLGNSYMDTKNENTVNQARYALRQLHGVIRGGTLDRDRCDTRHHAPAGVHLSGTLRVQPRGGIRVAGTRSLERYGAGGMAEQRTHL